MDKDRDDEIYAQGVHDAQQGTSADDVMHSFTKGFTTNPRENEIYNKGYEYGHAHRQERVDRERAAARESERADYSPRRESSGDGSEIIGKLIAYLIAGFAILWFVFSVAIPVVLMDIALISLILSFSAQRWKLLLLSASILGAAFVVLDYRMGGVTAEFTRSVSFLSGLVGPIVYLNLAAGLTGAYLLLRDMLNRRTPEPESPLAMSRTNLLAMGGLLALGTTIVLFVLRPPATAPTAQRISPTAAVSPTGRTQAASVPEGVLAAESAVEVQRRHALAAVERERVAREVAGKWSGRFVNRGACSEAGAPRDTPSAHLHITNDLNSFRATLLVRQYDVIRGSECGVVRVVYEGSLVDVNGSVADSTFLQLTPVSQTGDAGWADGEFYTPLFAVPNGDGTLRAWTANSPRLQLGQASGADDERAERLAEWFKTLPNPPTEIFPQRDMRLYNAVGDFIWDDLRIADLQAQQLRLYDEGIAVSAHGTEYRRTIISGPNYQLRKAWMRWD